MKAKDYMQTLVDYPAIGALIVLAIIALFL